MTPSNRKIDFLLINFKIRTLGQNIRIQRPLTEAGELLSQQNFETTLLEYIIIALRVCPAWSWEWRKGESWPIIRKNEKGSNQGQCWQCPAKPWPLDSEYSSQ